MYNDFETRVRGHSRSSEPTRIDPPRDFLLTFCGNYGPISYRFRDKRRFQPKIAKGPVNFAPTMKVVLLELGISAWESKTRIVGLPGRERCLMISSAIWIQYSTRTWRTDGWTPADSKDRANAWRHAVKSIFAHAPLYPVMVSFKSKYD